jgi:hypothetical protein
MNQSNKVQFITDVNLETATHADTYERTVTSKVQVEGLGRKVYSVLSCQQAAAVFFFLAVCSIF